MGSKGKDSQRPGMLPADRGTGEQKSVGHTLESEAGSCRGFYESTFKEEKKKQLAALSFCCSSGKFENALCASRGQWPREEPRPHSCPCICERSTAAAA